MSIEVNVLDVAEVLENRNYIDVDPWHYICWNLSQIDLNSLSTNISNNITNNGSNCSDFNIKRQKTNYRRLCSNLNQHIKIYNIINFIPILYLS